MVGDTDGDESSTFAWAVLKNTRKTDNKKDTKCYASVSHILRVRYQASEL